MATFLAASLSVSNMDPLRSQRAAKVAAGAVGGIFGAALLILAIIQNSRGNKGVWQTPVSEVPFFGSDPASGPPMTDKMGYPQQTTGDHSYPPQNYPQQAYTPPAQAVQV